MIGDHLKVVLVVIALALLVMLTGAIDRASAENLPQAATVHAQKYLQVRELTGRNDHPDIDRFLKYLGLPKGLSWCAAYVLYSYKEAADELHVRQPLPRYGRVARLADACQRNPLKYRWITTDDVRFGSVRLQPGDMPMWANGTIRAGDFDGHIGLELQQLSPMKIRTIEGNTSSGNKGSQREGNGVFIRERVINPGSFRIIGFCRVRT